MMKRAFCIVLFCITIFLMGCGEYATSHSETDINTDSSSQNYNTEQLSESFFESNTESDSNDDLNKSSKIEDNSDYSCSEESFVTSDKTEGDNTLEIYNEIEIDFSEFE